MVTTLTTVGLSAVPVWFCSGAAILTAIGRGPAFAMSMPGETEPPPPKERLDRLGMWFFQCLVWPHALYRWALGFGEFHGHFAADCPHRVEVRGADEAKPHWNRYRHGTACRRRK
ncbi:hypothetical protein FM076_02475 [Streptomyces albus subsp. chlorinus]|uniref:hypothetical protein n=1 Tax=Streptomyces albus TaxID=1888 RepID=UPI0015700770|nr:hypothetical protein [Streptomyces albus]NSC20134.1 hypothetical protein [Streptomyces albus subsp. chlorinus]